MFSLFKFHISLMSLFAQKFWSSLVTSILFARCLLFHVPTISFKKGEFKPFVSWLETLTFFSCAYVNTHTHATHVELTFPFIPGHQNKLDLASASNSRHLSPIKMLFLFPFSYDIFEEQAPRSLQSASMWYPDLCTATPMLWFLWPPWFLFHNNKYDR